MYETPNLLYNILPHWQSTSLTILGGFQLYNISKWKTEKSPAVSLKSPTCVSMNECQARLCVNMCVCMCVCTHTHMHIHTHTYIALTIYYRGQELPSRSLIICCFVLFIFEVSSLDINYTIFRKQVQKHISKFDLIFSIIHTSFLE